MSEILNSEEPEHELDDIDTIYQLNEWYRIRVFKPRSTQRLEKWDGQGGWAWIDLDGIHDMTTGIILRLIFDAAKAGRRVGEQQREIDPEHVRNLERVAGVAKKLTPHIPEVGEVTVCYESLTDETNVVTQEVQDIIWGLTNDYDEALAALEDNNE